MKFEVIIGGGHALKRIKILLVVIMMFQLLIIIYPKEAQACGCDHPNNAIETLSQSTAVFTGKVKGKKITEISGETLEAVRIEVDQIWKGIKETEIIIYTPGSSCYFNFKEGHAYLIYGEEFMDIYYVNSCGSSNEKSKRASDIIKQLGAGIEPSVVVDLSSESFKSSKKLNIEWIIGFFIILIVIISYYIRQGRLRK